MAISTSTPLIPKPGRIGLLVLAVLFGLVPLVTTAAPNFNDPGFANTWNRVDKPVDDLAGGAGRGYTWGPTIPQAYKVTKEPYNGGERTIQYFDKARMEVNNPNGNPQDLYYVTTGLLVKELVTGNRQDGDNTFTKQLPSEVQVAGDSNENGSNQVAPTYASFQYLGTFSGTENGQPPAPGQVITQSVARGGAVAFVTPPPEQRLITGYDDVTRHNIPDVFVNFGNSEGLVWNGSTTVNGKVLFDNPTYVLGRPLTEAYWTRAVVAGKEQDVLVQLFERRVLTYTPANPDPYKVEMGNVGQHYYRWRYGSAVQPALTKVWEVGKDPIGMQEPQQVAVDRQGNVFVLTNNTKGIQKYDPSGKLITSWGSPVAQNDRLVVDSQGNVYRGSFYTKQVEKWDNNGNPLAPIGSEGTGPGQFESIEGLGIDRQDNLYVLDTSKVDIAKKVVQKFDSTGKLVSRLDIKNAIPINVATAGSYIALDSQGNLYINGNKSYTHTYSRQVIYKLDSAGNYLSTLEDSNFNYRYVVIDANDNLFTLKGDQIVKLDKNFKLLASFNEKEIPDNEYSYISGLAIDQQGNLYSADLQLNWVQKFNNLGNYLGKFGSYATGAGQLRSPEGVALNDEGNIYVANTRKACIDKYDSNGRLLMEFGSRGKGNGQFISPTSVVADSSGNIYVADTTNKTIQKFDANGNFLQNWGDFPTRAPDPPYRLRIDGQDNIYVFFDGLSAIQMFNQQGQYLRSIGIFGTSHNQLNLIVSFTVDWVKGQPGKVYILDEHMNEDYLVVRQYDSDGKLLDNLDNSQNPRGLDLTNPQALAVDGSGNFYIADYNGQIKKFNTRAEPVSDWGPETYSPESRPGILDMVLDNQGYILAVDLSGDWLLKLRQF